MRLKFVRIVAAFILAAVLMTAFALPVYAGVFDVFGKIKTVVTEQALTVLMTAVITALGAFGLSYKLWGKAAKELFEFVKAIFGAVDPDGPDGRQINDAEMERIVKEGMELYPAVTAALAAAKRK